MKPSAAPGSRRVCIAAQERDRLTLVATTGLVGRQDEVRVVREALDGLAEGQGRLLLVVGGAGLGKSRLAAEGVALARERGILASWGRCRETEGAPAFWPWAQILRSIRRDIPAVLERAMGEDADLLAHVLPDLGSGRASVDPFRIYDAMARALASVAAEYPLLVVLDDLHCADAGSLRMLRFFASDIEPSRIVMLGTYREEELSEGHLLAKIVGEVATQAATRLVALAGLDLPSVAALISSITGSPEDSVTAITVRERTGGNPFFVTEVARLGPAGPVPLGVREAIRARLRRLPEATRAVLSTASVLGRDFGGELLEGVSELCGASLVAALQPAAQARLIISDTERQGRYRFVHALVQEVLYDELSDEVRRATHARADDAIDRLAAPARDARIEEQAFHACAALDGPASRTRAAALCAAAGRRATAALAYEDAARWYGKALDIEPDLPSPDLLFAHADALARASRGVEARGQYEAAFHRAIRDGDGARAARAALGVGDGVASAGVIDESLLRMLEHAERLVARDDVVSIRLEARKAIELYWQPDRTPARETAARALMRAESGGHAKALGEALHARRFVLRGPDDLAERIALGERMVRLAENTGDEELELSAYAWLIPEYFAAGDIVLVGRAHAALDDLERSVRRPLARWHVHLFSGMRAVFEGRYTDALSTIERARYLGSRVGSQPADMFAAAQRAVVLRDFGRAAESIDELRRLSTAYPLLLTLSCEIAMLLAEVGQRAEASELLDRVAHDGFSVVPRDSLWRASIALAAQAASTLGHVAHARTAYELLLPFVGINVVQGVPVAWGATDHYLGIASVAAGELDAAIGHLDAAARLHGAWGASALGVASRAELANALHKRGRAEDRARVLGLEAAVRTQAQHLGIVRPLLARDRRAAADLSIPDAPLAGLTERERTIIGLLATGQANKEIAHALCISVHTVERHLANLYAKIGARNRADAAAYAVAHGHRRPPSGST